jgi:transcriptional regulator with XRE-family HTH domain
MKLGKQITYMRGLANMERKEVAEKLGITLQQYSNIENDHSGVDETRLADIAQILKTKPETIKNLDLERVYQQTNNDNSTGGHMGTINQMDKEILQQLLDTNKLLIEMMDKRIAALEQKLEKIQ